METLYHTLHLSGISTRFRLKPLIHDYGYRKDHMKLNAQSRPSIAERTRKRALEMRRERNTPYARVLDYLYIGCDPGSSGVLPPGTTHVINLTQRPRTYKGHSAYRCLHFPMADSEAAAPLLVKAAPRLCKFIDSARNGACFVHCKSGISRSASVVLYYLITQTKSKTNQNKNMSLREAFAYLKKKRPSVNPNSGFMSALCEVELELFNARPSIDVSRYRQHSLGVNILQHRSTNKQNNLETGYIRKALHQSTRAAHK